MLCSVFSYISGMCYKCDVGYLCVNIVTDKVKMMSQVAELTLNNCNEVIYFVIETLHINTINFNIFL